MDRDEQLDELRKSLDLPPEDVPLDQVVPVFVPASPSNSGKWPGPIVQTRVPELAITWACLRPAQTMLYVSFETARSWENEGVDWRTASMENLASMSEQISSHSFEREDDAYYGLVMMHEDGVGPSRLLLNVWLEEVFPQGYMVAVPERSVGVVLSRTASKAELEQVDDLVVQCYENGDRPLKRGMFDPDLLTAASSD